MLYDILFAGAGFVIGAFCPSVLRSIKAWFVKESASVKKAAPAPIASAISSVEAEAKKL